MPEKCPYCGRECANSKALGSHIHYAHEPETWAQMSQERSEGEKQRFAKLLDSCSLGRGLPKARQVDKIQQAVTEIPEGISPLIDGYRQAYRCAVAKEKLVKEIEEAALKEANADDTE